MFCKSHALAFENKYIYMIQVIQRVDTDILDIMSVALFGILLTALVGFSSPVHNYVHDTRHSVGFPCH